MKKFILLTALFFVCPPYADFREYHYNRPQIPFQQPPSSSQIAASYNPPANSANYAHSNGNAFIQNFRQGGVAQDPRQFVAPAANGYQPQHVAPSQHYTPIGSQVSYNQANNGGYHSGGGISNHASSIAASYHPQQQYTPNVNPLTQQTQYHQQQQQQPQQHYQQQQQQQFQQQQYQQQQQLPYVNLPQAGPHNTQNYYANSQQQGATGLNNGAGIQGQRYGQSGQTLSLNGNFVSQSEAGQLHSYQHQQQPLGDTRPFSRQITVCQPNGQCEQKTLSAGQVDPHHQQTVTATRAKTVPRVDKCRQIAEAKKLAAIASNGGSFVGGLNNGGFQNVDSYTRSPEPTHYGGLGLPLRDRRLFPYSEVVLPNDPYN